MNRTASRKLFLASKSEAIQFYPEIILSLARNKLSVVSGSPVTTKKTVIVSDGTTSTLLLEEDFILIRNIASNFCPVSAFLSEPLESVYSHIRAFIEVEFSNREDF